MHKVIKPKIIEHRFVTYKMIPWPVCIQCGLVALKNERTEKAIRKGCIIE